MKAIEKIIKSASDDADYIVVIKEGDDVCDVIHATPSDAEILIITLLVNYIRDIKIKDHNPFSYLSYMNEVLRIVMDTLEELDNEDPKDEEFV